MFNKLIDKFFKKQQIQIEGYNQYLVIGSNYYNKFRDKQDIEAKLLAEEITKHGVNPILIGIKWPRDELFFYSNGRYDYVQSETIQPEMWEHEAYHGGRFLKGDGFLIGSDSMNPKKREKTELLLGVKKGFYLPVKEMTKFLENILINKKKIYPSTHIDTIMGIANKNKTLFTYDHPELKSVVEKISKEINYNFKTIPLEEAGYLAINFIELGNHIILDRRAKKTYKIMKNLKYNIIKSPWPMKDTNKGGGGIRCITNEIPKCYDKLIFYNEENKDKFPYFDEIEASRAMLRNLKGEALITFDNYNGKFGPYLYENREESINHEQKRYQQNL